MTYGRIGRAPERGARWRREFPYRRDVDDLVSRRQFLHFTVFASGALFAGTVAFALLGRFTDRRRGERREIGPANAVAPGEALYFNYPGDGDQAVLLNLGERGLVAYSQRCTHLACAVRYEGERDRLFCPCHDGVFDPASGEPVAGPPRRRLARISLEVRNGTVFALEEVP